MGWLGGPDSAIPLAAVRLKATLDALDPAAGGHTTHGHCAPPICKLNAVELRQRVPLECLCACLCSKTAHELNII